MSSLIILYVVTDLNKVRAVFVTIVCMLTVVVRHVILGVLTRDVEELG